MPVNNKKDNFIKSSISKKKSAEISLPASVKIIFWLAMIEATILFVVAMIFGLLGGGIFSLPIFLIAIVIGRIAYDIKRKRKYAYWAILIFSGLACIYSFTSIILGYLSALTSLLINLGIVYLLLRKEAREIYM